MITSRFYNVNGMRWEARFFRKGDTFPGTESTVPKQGVWARLETADWDSALFVGASWGLIQMDTDVLYLPERR